MPAHRSEPLFITTGEGRFAWVEARPEGEVDSDSLPLVLLHGFTGHRDDFLSVLASLGRTRRVLVPDLRGHGDSDPNPGVFGWSFEQLVRDLVSFLDALEIPRIDLLGHSMGGFVAQRFVLSHPDRVRSLALLCTGPEVPASLSREGFEKAAAIARARGMDGLQGLLEKVGRADASPSIASWGELYWTHQRQRFSAMTPDSYAGIGTAFFDSESLVDRLHQVTQPTLVMVGEFDEDWLPGAALFLQNCPAARGIELRQAEHHPHQENTRDFLAALEAHLDAVREANES